MTTESQTPKRATPVFGILSVVAPVIGTLTAYALTIDSGNPRGSVYGLYIVIAAGILGVIFAIKARRLGERYRALPHISLWLFVVVILAILVFLVPFPID
jgi:hypothetical protein